MEPEGQGCFISLPANQMAGFKIMKRFNRQNMLPDPLQIQIIEARCPTFLNSGSPVTIAPGAFLAFFKATARLSQKKD